MPNGTIQSTKRTLSPAWQRIVELMQEIQFGSIEGLHVVDGEPDPTSRFRVAREIVFGRENGPNPARRKEDFALKAQHVELLDVLMRERSATVERLAFQNGLPVRMTVVDERRVL